MSGQTDPTTETTVPGGHYTYVDWGVRYRNDGWVTVDVRDTEEDAHEHLGYFEAGEAEVVSRRVYVDPWVVAGPSIEEQP